MRAGVVVFEKDGVLLDEVSLWIGLARERLVRLRRQLALDAERSDRLVSALGIAPQTGEIVDPGVLTVSRHKLEERVFQACLGGVAPPDAVLGAVRAALWESETATRIDEFVMSREGVPELLSSLQQRQIPSVVLTSAPTRASERQLAAARLLPHIKRVYGCDILESTKPSPAALQNVCADLHLSTTEAVVVSHDPMDFVMAREVGAAGTIAIRPAGSSAREYAGADVAAGGLSEIVLED